MDTIVIFILSFVIGLLSVTLFFFSMRLNHEKAMRKIYAKQVLGAYKTFKWKDRHYHQLLDLFEQFAPPKDQDLLDRKMPKHERRALLKIHHRSLDAAADVIKTMEKFHDESTTEASDQNASDRQFDPLGPISENPNTP